MVTITDIPALVAGAREWADSCDRASHRQQINDLCDTLEAQAAEIARLERLALEYAEESMWAAYHTGHTKDGRWSHMFMSDGEWLAQRCGFDPRDADYDDEAIRNAIPAAARALINQTGESGE